MSSTLPKLAVLISGKGSNLQSLIEHIQKGNLKAEIAVVISNKADALGLQKAKAAGIHTVVIPHENHKDRNEYDKLLLKQILEYKAQYVVLAGFMRILSSEFVASLPNRIINIHPSLLPKYPGLQPIQKALSNGDQETGVTVHFVDAGVDAGPVIMQQAVPIESGDTLEVLTARVQAAEHQIYAKALQKVLWGK